MNKIKLNAIQYKFWMDDLLKYPSCEYNDTNLTFVVTGDLSVERLRDAYSRIMLEYPPLHSHIHMESDSPYFIIDGELSEIPFQFKKIDTCSVPEIQQMISELVSQPFQLSKEYPCRFYVLYDGHQYYLVHIIHHVAIDGISFASFFARLSEIYNSLAEDTYTYVGQQDALEKFNLSFDTAYEAQKAENTEYWQNYLSGLSLQLSIPHTTELTSTGQAYTFDLGGEVNRSVQTFCSNEHVTPFRLFSAVWALTLSRVSRADELLLDHTLSLHPDEFRDLWGVYVNNLPLKFSFLDTDKSFRSVLQRLGADRNAENSHRNIFYHDFLNQSLEGKGQGAGVNVAINYPTRWKQMSLNLEGCETKPFMHADVPLSADLVLMIEDNECLSCTLRYQSHYPVRLIRDLGLIFREILLQVTDNVDMSLKDIHLLPDSIQRSLLAQQNRNISMAEQPHTFLPRFATMVKTYGGHPAVEDANGSLSYSQLDALSDQVAGFLLHKGWNQQYIGLSTPKNLMMIVGIMGIIKSGNVYVPIDHELPAERIRFMIDDCHISAVLTTRDTSVSFGTTLTCPIEDILAQHLDGYDMAVDIKPTDEAYVIYTSGTTGKPKAIPIRHYMLNQMVVNHIGTQLWHQDSRIPQFANICFDASILEIFSILNVGGTLVLPQEMERKDPSLFLSFLDKKKITLACIPPTLFSILPHRDLPLLKGVVLGGDSASPQAIQFWTRGRRIIDAYGPAESTVDVTYAVLDPDSAPNDIGLAEPGVSCYVIDSCGHLVPDYILGELCIGGMKLTDGYINRPELNKKKFVSNPFVSEEDRSKGRNTILYRTGDLVMRREDGHLLFMGREDFQVKLHGFRIELGDIETQTMAYGHGIKSAMAMMHQQEQLKQLVVYIVTDSPEDLDAEDLRAYLRQHLPVYMVPAIIIPLESFPYNTSGKVDRHRLPDPSQYQAYERKVTAPATPTEKRLAELWQHLLPGQQFGRDDDFTSLGGDSLAVIQLAFDIEESFQAEVRASDIYCHSTLSSLAEYIDSHISSFSEHEHDEEVLYQNGHLPLSPTQMSLWLQCVQSPEMSESYNVPCLFECPEHTQPHELESILNLIVQHQDSFRMSFPIDDNRRPYIRISDYVPFGLELKSVSSEELSLCLIDDLQVTFNLEEGPLYKIHIYKVNGERLYCSLIMHHLISDGWSAELMQRIVLRSLSGEKMDWSQFNGSYAAYVRQSNEMSHDKAYGERLSYWNNLLSDVSDLQMLEANKGSDMGIHGGMCSFTFTTQCMQQVNVFCEKNGFTPFEVYCAVYLLFLSRWSGQSDFAIGFPYLGREHGRYQLVIGFFVHTLPLIYKKEYNDMTFSQYIKAIHQQLIDAESHAVSFDQLVSMTRTNTGTPNLQLVQSMFTMGSDEQFYQYLATEHVPFPVVMTILTGEDYVSCRMEYQYACLSEQEVTNWFEAYSTLLLAVVSDAECPVLSYALTSASYQQTIIDANCCSAHLPVSASDFVERFRTIAHQYPDKAALIYGGTSITYAELDKTSSEIANHIRRAGISASSSIAINMSGSIHSLTAIIGILKAGCCYVPIDIALPDERRSFILKDAGCAMLFDTEHYPEGQVLVDMQQSLYPEDVAYIIYTSGTTGLPKGVPVTHSALAHLLDVLPPVSGMTADSRVLLFASISFDASVTQIFTSLSMGATLVIADSDERKDLRLMADLIERQSITYIEIPAAILPLLPQRQYPLLKTVIVGGESCSESVLRSWAKDYRVINAYGPTENTVDTTLCVVGNDFESNDIGLPLSGVSCYVLDKNKNIVPSNMAGELYIGGVQLTRGYLNRPELNIDKFVSNPFVTAEDAALGLNTILYRSGDMVKRRSDGHIIFAGRADFQVKLHGYRIELGEIETHIGQFSPQVKGACVLLNETSNRQQLVAYVQVNDAESFDTKALRQHLSLQLPPYMVPAVIVPMNEFPFNANGKIDRRRLPDPSSFAPDDHETAGPITPTEQRLATLWQEIFPGQVFGRNDDILSLGGDSLAIIQLSFIIEEQWGIRIPAADIYQHLCLSDLAAYIDLHLCEKKETDSVQEQVPKVHFEKDPLSPHQFSLWLQCVQSEQMKNTYNLPCFFECPPSTTPEAFAEVMNRLIENQESFRMSFPIDTDGQPYIALSPYEKIEVAVDEITSEQLTAALNRDMKVSFVLTEAPLYCVRLYHIDGRRYYCSLVMHHLISDGWSAQLVMRLITDTLSGRPVDWNSCQGSYLDYARRAYLFKDTEAYRSRLDYWSRNLVGISDLQILKPKKGRSDCNMGASYVCPFPKGLDEAVKAFCRDNSCTPFHCYSFVYLLLLARLSGQTDFAVAFPYLGREKGEYNSIVGYFVNILPLCYRSAYSKLTFRQYMQTMSQSLVNTEKNSISLDEIVQTLRRENGDQSLQLVQTLFTYEQSNLVYESLQAGHADFSLTFSVIYNDDGCACSLGYQHACFDEGEIRSWVETYYALLHAVVTHPDLQLDMYPLLSDERLHTILQQQVCYPTAAGAPKPFLQRFAMAVDTFPQKTAIIFRDMSITYAALDKESDCIRDRILSAGIQTPASVGVNMVASIHSMAVILGILKAHCSYVPIDVSLPDERRDFILKDAACVMTFTEENYPLGEVLASGISGNASLQNIAYIIYTSGTTGIPKGVPISMSSMGYLAETVRRDYEVTPESRNLLFASISFDVSVADIFSIFAVGATMVIAAPEERKDPNLLVDLLERQQVTCASIAPAMLVVLPHRELPLLTTMVVAGESPVYSALMYWAKGRKMINAYGPTESTVYTTRCVVKEDYEDNDIGLPLPGVTCYVLDKNMQLVPDNLKGELYIGGLQLTEGYLNRPELNREKFIENPFVLSEDREKGLNTVLYKCGDVVIRRPNGHIIFMGRTDRQVKLRGFRIELSEIENHLSQCEGVQRAVVQLRKNEGQDELVAYVQSEQGTEARTLQQTLRSKMPLYMVPTKWAILSDFPLTVNGKTDWRRMPEPQVVMTEDLVLPATDDERILLEAACRILGTDAIGVETDLFDEAGMTSIQVMEFVMTVCDIHSHFRFNISSVYRNRTLRHLLHDQGSKLYFWLDEYRPDKPLMVLTCGFPYLQPFYDNFVDYFRDKFNIFVFESYTEYFRYRTEVSLQALIDHYMQLAHVVLADRTIDVVTGYCVGSEIAMRLADRLHREGWQMPKVLMMEAFYARPKGIAVPHISDVRIIQQNYEISQQLFDTFSPLHFDGNLMLTYAQKPTRRFFLDAEEETDEAIVAAAQKEAQETREQWRREYPQAPYLEVDATHWTFFEQKPLHQIWDAMKKYGFGK